MEEQQVCSCSMNQLSVGRHSLKESAHNSASHSCAQLLLCNPWLWRHRNTQVEVVIFWRRASFCYCASPDSPLFITAKKISAPWQAEGSAVAAASVQNIQALVEEPYGPWGRKWCFSTAGFYVQRASDLQWALCVPSWNWDSQRAWGTSFQDPLFRPLCTFQLYTEKSVKNFSFSF